MSAFPRPEGKRKSTHLSIDIATKLNIDDVEQITSIAI